MQRLIKTTTNYIFQICTGKKNVKNLLMLSLMLSVAAGCKKSSTGGATSRGNLCTTDSCILTSQTWRISSITDHCDIGDYTATLGTNPDLSTIEWATFLFNANSTLTLTGGGHGDYTYTPSDKSLVLTFNALPLHFNVTSLTKTSLAFTGAKFQMNPRTDPSPEATYAIKSIAGDLHDNYGVDTSKIHYVQVSFSYY
jgi:hypothetical protein